MPILRGLLDDVGDEDHVALVCDADGSLLWLDGRPALVERAREVHLELGSVWSEAAAGTNAMGTALAEHHAVQVFSAEHFAAPVHSWTCSAAPVHDPATGAVLGVIDLTGELATAHPHSLAVVSLAAKTIEHHLALRAQADPDAAPLPGVTLSVLGRERAVALAGGRRLELSRRHTEMLLLLWLHGEGLTAEQLALEVYGERGRPGTVRTEMHRLRAQLGSLWVSAPTGCLARWAWISQMWRSGCGAVICGARWPATPVRCWRTPRCRGWWSCATASMMRCAPRCLRAAIRSCWSSGCAHPPAATTTRPAAS